MGTPLDLNSSAVNNSNLNPASPTPPAVNMPPVIDPVAANLTSNIPSLNQTMPPYNSGATTPIKASVAGDTNQKAQLIDDVMNSAPVENITPTVVVPTTAPVAPVNNIPSLGDNAPVPVVANTPLPDLAASAVVPSSGAVVPGLESLGKITNISPVTANLGPNNIPIESLAGLNAPVTPIVSVSPDLSATPVSQTVEILPDLNPISAIPATPEPVIPVAPPVVSYEQVNTGLNKVVHQQNNFASDNMVSPQPVGSPATAPVIPSPIIVTAGPSLSDLIADSNTAAGIYNPTPAPLINDSPVVPNNVLNNPTINTIAPAQVVPQVVTNLPPQPQVVTNNLSSALQSQFTEQSGPAIVTTPLNSPQINTLPPLNAQKNENKPAKGSMTKMIIMIIIFFLLGVVLLIVGLYLSNSFSLPFAIPFLDKIIGGGK
ncbi:MAG: hypothetical protein WCJ58_02175 [bacterium]